MTRCATGSSRTAVRVPVAMARSRASANNSATSRAALCTLAASSRRAPPATMVAEQHAEQGEHDDLFDEGTADSRAHGA